MTIWLPLFLLQLGCNLTILYIQTVVEFTDSHWSVNKSEFLRIAQWYYFTQGIKTNQLYITW
jgi:hypothetical protein